MNTTNQALDRQAIEDELRALMLSGMPEAVVMGLMTAKVKALADRHAEAQWDEVRRICDEVGYAEIAEIVAAAAAQAEASQ